MAIVDGKTILRMVIDAFGLKRDSTEDRLRLQKTIYLLEIHGLQLGYGFSWYKYGPYSQDLVYDAYTVLSNEKDTYDVKVSGLQWSDNTEERFAEFRTICGGILNDASELELAASVDFVRQTWCRDRPDEEVVKEFLKRKTRYWDGREIEDRDIKQALDTVRHLRKELCPN